ncbi:hypothetical protein PENSOL_c002G03246 [Penicillium solitum]|uniref:Uncharacterized protein n=1 Tax=Penicillium solitum TaxID=60172 RepID=A0A1V6RMB9_9EURO|nr:uncharacterized protein PENSOL_c002G03246 [Penicillium solitum]OQE02579.1 hypothetical protein PENSOL_c002G03246 [Penicillium solitum]
MPRYAPPSEESSYPFGHNTVGHNDYRDDGDDCIFPAFPSRSETKWIRPTTTGVIWFALVAFGSYVAIAVVVTVLFAVNTDNKGVHQGTAEYALYKNTRFKECYGNPALDNANNCTVIDSYLKKSMRDLASQGISYVNKLEYYDANLPDSQRISYSWCQVAGCFNDYKVVPSEPRSTAFWATTIGASTEVYMILLAALWQLSKLHKAQYSDETESCKMIEWDIWIIQLWELVSVGWWWFDFGRHVTDRSIYPAPGMLSWIPLWKYGYLLNFHPYSCALRHNPRAALAGKWLMNTLAFVQWVISVYIWRSNTNPQSPYSTYDCLASQISIAPGTSTCPVEQICARDLLFRSYDFAFSDESMDITDPEITMFVAFCILSIGIVGRFLLIGVLPVVLHLMGKGSVQKLRAKTYEHDIGYAGSVGGASLVCIIVGGFTTAGAILAFWHGRESAFVIDWTCKTVHVDLSAWRYYLDVEYELPLRAVKMWFNV